jgi:hypothetical protein
MVYRHAAARKGAAASERGLVRLDFFGLKDDPFK